MFHFNLLWYLTLSSSLLLKPAFSQRAVMNFLSQLYLLVGDSLSFTPDPFFVECSGLLCFALILAFAKPLFNSALIICAMVLNLTVLLQCHLKYGQMSHQQLTVFRINSQCLAWQFSYIYLFLFPMVMALGIFQVVQMKFLMMFPRTPFPTLNIIILFVQVFCIFFLRDRHSGSVSVLPSSLL